MTAASTDYWLSTSEQSQEPPRPFWHRKLFYQRPDTSKSLAEEPWAREVHMEDRKAWKMAEAFRVPLSFTSNSKLIPHLPSPHQPQNRKAEEVMWWVLRSLAQPQSLWGKSECWWWDLGFYTSSLWLFGRLPIFCIKFLSPTNHKKKNSWLNPDLQVLCAMLGL